MKRAPTCLLLTLPFALLAPSAMAAGLQPYVASYEVIRNGDTLGHATVTLRQTPGGWDYDTQTHGTNGLAALAAADIQEHSVVSEAAGLLQMSSYHYRLSTLVKSQQRDIVVDEATHKVTIRDKKNSLEFPLQPGMLDQNSVTLGIARDLASGKHGTLSYTVATKNKIDTQRYQVGHEQTLKVPAGSLRTIEVSRLRDSADGRTTTSWFGLDNGFVPVRSMQHEPGGETLEMELVSLRK